MMRIKQQFLHAISLNKVRQAASMHLCLRESCVDSTEPLKVLLHDFFNRYLLAKDEDILKFEEALLMIVETIEEGEKFTKASLKLQPMLSNFMNIAVR